MAVFTCDCGLIISTPSARPRCLRCLRVLGPNNIEVRQEADRMESKAASGRERLRQFCQMALARHSV